MVANVVRCAIYTRKSTEEGLGQDFNSLDAQREACAAYITSQKHEGWQALPTHYDDGGYSGGNTNRPALLQLFEDIKAGKVNTIVVYKIDRLTRSLADFAKMVELFDAHGVSFVAVTQQFNTTTSMGRLTLNVLLSFAQFEREVTGERIRDKIAASKAKGMWMGGVVPLGYELKDRGLHPHPHEAELIRHIFTRYTVLSSVQKLRNELNSQGYRTKSGKQFFAGHLSDILKNRIYLGEVTHKGKHYDGKHHAIISKDLWENVQELRSTKNAFNKKREGAKESSLLAGIMFDAEGHGMGPTHSTKRGRRYRYYVSQALVQGKSLKSDTLAKVPAGELESFLIKRIGDLLANDGELTTLMPMLSPQQRQSAQNLGALWKVEGASMLRVYLRQILKKVVLRNDAVECMLNPEGMGLSGDTLPDSEHSVTVEFPVQLKRIAKGTTMMFGATETLPNPTLVKAIAQAYSWNKQLLGGKSKTLKSLAEESQIHPRVMRRIMPLAYLAPDIVEAILDGQEPKGLTLSKLLDLKTMDWQEQRKVLGFPARL